jgi:ferredoxin, 2Fe-2S
MARTVSITLIHADGRSVDIQAPVGDSLMHAAVDAGVDGIAADCGGMLSCATCHVLPRPPHASILPAALDDERAMLPFTACPAQPHSRLACQINLTPDLDGAVFDLPRTQY